MSSIVINIGGTGGRLGKFANGMPSLQGGLHAAYLWGSDFHGAGLFPGASVKDLSDNGRDAAIVGGGIAPKWLATSPASFATLPFSTAQVAAAGGAVAFVSFFAAANTAGFQLAGGIGVNSPGSTRNAGVIASEGQLSVFSYQGGQTDLGTSTFVRAADRFEMVVGCVSPGGATIYRRRSDMTASEYVEGPGGAVTGTNPMRVGATLDESAFNGSAKVAMSLIGSKMLSRTYCDTALWPQMLAMARTFALPLGEV